MYYHFCFSTIFSFLLYNFIGTLFYLIHDTTDRSPFLFSHEGLVGYSRLFSKHVPNKNPSVFYPLIKYGVYAFHSSGTRMDYLWGKLEQLNELSGFEQESRKLWMFTGSCGWWWQRPLNRGWASHPDFDQINSTFSCFIYSLLACYSKNIFKSHTDYHCKLLKLMIFLLLPLTSKMFWFNGWLLFE